ncbi:MAG: DedA family protein [Proteobacteria bacterium]|nr:DedA family protein [Pseudomonadota bacterium]
MPEWIIANEYLYLFLISFLASTLIPLGSEWLLAALVVDAANPIGLVCVASIGNVLGATTTYAIGRYGGGPLAEKLLGINAEKREKADAVYKKYGAWSLFFSFLPVIGDPLCLVGGFLRVPMALFFPLVLGGKSLRYLFVMAVVRNAF